MYIIGKAGTDPQEFLVDYALKDHFGEFHSFDMNITQVFTNFELTRKLCDVKKKNKGYDLEVYAVDITYIKIWSTVERTLPPTPV